MDLNEDDRITGKNKRSDAWDDGPQAKRIAKEDESSGSELEEGEMVSEDESVEEDAKGMTDAEKDTASSTPDIVNEKETAEKPEGLVQYKYKKILKNSNPASSLPPLPEGWSEAKHECGIPVYWHADSKVVTWSRPYTLDGHLLKHDVPLLSIPCLNEQKFKDNASINNESSTTVTSEDPNKETSEQGQTCNKPKVILHDHQNGKIGKEELETYLAKRFEFETLKIMHFEKWSHRRNYYKKQENENKQEKDKATSNNTSLITLTVENTDENNKGTGQTKKIVLTTSGKPLMCILHEYAQRVMKVQPKYEFSEIENTLEPFQAVITLDGKKYGIATAINKKKAKTKAALETLEMLIPGFKDRLETTKENNDSSYFDNVSVLDPRVYEICVHSGQANPYQLLAECLKRNQGITDTSISYEIQQVRQKSITYVMKCGFHEIEGTAKNKKVGKQLGAQQMLNKLHPQIKLYKELIEMYGQSIAQERAKKKQVEQEIFDLKQRRTIVDNMQEKNKSKSEQNSLEPNPELLAKLKEMMLKLQQNQDKQSCAKMTPMEAALATGKSFEMTN